MTTGGGRFALASRSPVVQQFFDLSNTIPPGTYTLSGIQALLGGATDAFSIVQSLLDDGQPDYAERSWVFNNGTFDLRAGVEFYVGPGGHREIRNLAVVPRQENFDWVSTIWFEPLNVLNNYLVDPSDIGRQVLINWVDDVATTTYNGIDFANDQGLEATHNDLTPDIVALADYLTDLFNEGVFKLITDDDLAIRYGSVGEDFIEAVYLFPHPFLHDAAVLGQEVYLGGDDDDFIANYGSYFRVFGGAGEDAVVGVNLSEYLTFELSMVELFAGSDDDHDIYIKEVDDPLFMTLGAGYNFITVEAENAELNISAGDGGTFLILSDGTLIDFTGGDSGDWIIVGATGGGIIDGGDGEDTISFENYASGLVVTLSASLTVGTYSLSGFENINGTQLADVIESDFGWVNGNGGDDVLTTSDGQNVMLDGGDGNDVIYTSDHGHALGGDGTDVIYVDGNIDPFWGYGDFETVVAANEVDVVWWDDPEVGVSTWGGADTITFGGSGSIGVNGGDGSDTFTWSSGWGKSVSVYATSLESVLDSAQGSISWIQDSASSYYYSSYSTSYGSLTEHSWYVSMGSGHGILSVDIRYFSGTDSYSTNIGYAIWQDTALEADSPWYGISVSLAGVELQSGDFGINW